MKAIFRKTGSAVIMLCLVALAFFYFSEAEGKEVGKMNELTISSSAFGDNERIPSKYTCDGSDVNPDLKIRNVPPGAKTLALIVDDPDAPMGTWVHWVLWNIDPKTSSIDEGSVPQGAVQGTNDFRKLDYGGPCPPSGTHRYFFKLYALDTQLRLSSGSSKAELEKAMEGHILSQARVIGLYSRK